MPPVVALVGSGPPRLSPVRRFVFVSMNPIADWLANSRRTRPTE